MIDGNLLVPHESRHASLENKQIKQLCVEEKRCVDATLHGNVDLARHALTSW